MLEVNYWSMPFDYSQLLCVQTDCILVVDIMYLYMRCLVRNRYTNCRNKKTGNNFYQKKIIEIYTTVFSSRFWTELLVICFCCSSKVSLYDILHCSLLLSRLCFCLGLSVRQQDHSVTYG